MPKRPAPASLNVSIAKRRTRSTTTLSPLCKLCRSLFERVRNVEPFLQDEFHNFDDLVDSVHSGCHFCSLVLKKFYLAKHIPGNSANAYVFPTKDKKICSRKVDAVVVQIRYVDSIGLSAIFFGINGLHNGCLGYVDFHFGLPSYTLERLASHSTDSDESWLCAESWINTCLSQHLACNELSQRSTTSYPTRLLVLDGTHKLGIRLSETDKLRTKPKYTTLSHCWGKDLPLRLQRNNYSEFTSGIPIEKLPKTFKDAIDVTLKLGLRYVWIDALCIIQDSITDWQTEAQRMLAVYSNSWLNIAAAGSEDSSGGLYQVRNPFTIIPCTIRVDVADHEYVTTVVDEIDDLAQSSLFGRAWVFQELILAPRTLIFASSGLFWLCRCAYGSEIFRDGFEAPSLEWAANNAEVLLKKLQKLKNYFLQTAQMRRIELWTLWNYSFHLYSGKLLSRPTDRLYALDGLAELLRPTMGSDSMDYLAGIWHYRLRKGLLWKRDYFPSDVPPLVQNTPSWSWASNENRIDGYDGPALLHDGLVEILDAHIEQVGFDNALEHSLKGYIRLVGPMTRAVITQVSSRFFDVEINPLMARKPRNEHILPTVRCFVLFDNPDMDQVLKAEVYMMAFEVQCTSGKGCLRGLLLRPTHQRKGQFRRLGYFRINDECNNLSNTIDVTESNGRMPRSVSPKSLDTAYSNHEDSESENTSTFSSTCTDQYNYNLPSAMTANDIRQVRYQLKQHDKSLKVRHWHMHDEPIEESEEYDDRFGNGKIDGTLVTRFGEDSYIEYPRISSFLFGIQFLIDATDRKHLFVRQLEECEEDLGNGFYQIELV